MVSLSSAEALPPWLQAMPPAFLLSHAEYHYASEFMPIDVTTPHSQISALLAAAFLRYRPSDRLSISRPSQPVDCRTLPVFAAFSRVARFLASQEGFEPILSRAIFVADIFRRATAECALLVITALLPLLLLFAFTAAESRCTGRCFLY